LKKIKQKDIKKIDRGTHIALLLLGQIFILLGFFFMYQGVTLHYIGEKNVDLVYNYQNIRIELNPTLLECSSAQLGKIDEVIDTGLSGKEDYTLSEWYLIGVQQTSKAIDYFYFSGVSLILGFTLIINAFVMVMKK